MVEAEAAEDAHDDMTDVAEKILRPQSSSHRHEVVDLAIASAARRARRWAIAWNVPAALARTRQCST
jgi:hypothetical protein